MGMKDGNYRDYRGYIGIIGSILGLYWDNGKEMETTIVYWGCMRRMEKKMETTSSRAPRAPACFRGLKSARN